MKSWFQLFDECCIRAGQKNDEMKKGRLLILCLSGKALEVVEDFEKQKGEQQTYTSLMTELLRVFSDGESVEQKSESDNLVIEKPLVHSVNIESCDTDITATVEEPQILTSHQVTTSV